MAQARTKPTRERILDAAERLFGERGFAETSLREITARARVNLAAVHYHFGSKDGLIAEVLRRRLVPINRERLALLEAAEAEGTIRLEAVLEALVAPPLRLLHGAARERTALLRLMGRALNEPHPAVQAVLLEELRPLARRFARALERALPALPAEERFWRMHFCVGAMAHTIGDEFRLRLISEGQCGLDEDVERTIARLVRFLAAGFRAPAVVCGEVEAKCESL